MRTGPAAWPTEGHPPGGRLEDGGGTTHPGSDEGGAVLEVGVVLEVGMGAVHCC